jgi:uncharacterized repeat protein (TIGR03803 family)
MQNSGTKRAPDQLIASIFAAAMIIHAAGAEAATEKVLYSFKGDPDGSEPFAGLINVNGTLYGTTFDGGNAFGTVYSFNPSTHAEKVIYAFSDNPDALLPTSKLIELGGRLYGTTNIGGTDDDGAVFAIDLSNGTRTIVYSFKGGSTDGFTPYPGLIDVKGTLYGTTEYGGKYGAGTVYAIDAATRTEKVLYSFKGQPNDGSIPYGGVAYLKGMLYGTTEDGGANTVWGTTWSLNPTSGVEKVLHSFDYNGSDGYEPYTAMTVVGSRLYGTTSLGGPTGGGIIYSINPKNGDQTVVFGFDGTDGYNSDGEILDVKGTFYGTTIGGGATGFGNVYSFNPKTHAESSLHSFSNNGSDGWGPRGNLVDVNGVLYGTTEGGGSGSCDCGTIFSVTP